MTRASPPLGLGPLLLVGLALLSWARPLSAGTKVYALVIGNNNAFAAKAAERPGQAPLHYADDDAAAFAELVGELTDKSELLTVMDTRTQALYPKLAAVARVPTAEAVRGAVQRIRRRVLDQQAAGHRNVVFVFFSGHGSVDYDGKPALALSDGGLDQAFLYREILEQLPADEVHLLIDACHAEAIVRLRDSEAEVVSVSPAEAHAFLVQNTLARFPHVGAIVASSSDAKAQEWDAIRHGIFTHELLSALRGAADVNRDRRLEYSEVYAFMMAANREVRDSRARLAIVARPPDVNRRAALLTLSDFGRERSAWLANVPGGSGIVELDDVLGRRIATLHGDGEYHADLLVPAGTQLFLRAGEKEASLVTRPGQTVSFDSLVFAGIGLRERSALEEAVRRGLFAAAYGRRYYEGIVDQTPGFLPVDFSHSDPRPRDARAEHGVSVWNDRALVLAGGVSKSIADLASFAHGVTGGLRPLAGSGLALSLAALTGEEGALREWQLHASAGFVWGVRRGRVHGYAGATLGGGLLSQAIEPTPVRRSGFFEAVPIVGLTTTISGNFGLWSEVALSSMLYRLDDRAKFSFMPSAWLGGSWRL